MIHLHPAQQPLPSGAIPIDARTRAEYDVGHIPGAIHLAWEEWCAPAPAHAGRILAQPGYWGTLADTPPDMLAARLGSRGVSSDRPLVVYADGARSRGRDGRIAWMLVYLGGQDIFLLNGGWQGWISGGGRISVERSEIGTETFRLDLQFGRRIDLESLRRALGGPRPLFLIDTRSQAEYVGEVDEYLPRRGHLPGAVLVPFADLYDDHDRFVSRASYLERLPTEVCKSSNLVAYCEVGVRAGTFALLHEAHTGRVVTVYDGSLMEWSLDRSLPMATGIELGPQAE
jgi:thiosulfate/3-mercaptopyruvate sulfurtransferase